MKHISILVSVMAACMVGCASGPQVQVASPTNDTQAQKDQPSLFDRTSADVSKVGTDAHEAYDDAAGTVAIYWKQASEAWNKASVEATHYRLITAEQFARLSTTAERCYAIARASVPLEQQSVASLQAIAEGCYAQAHNPKQQ